MDLLCPVHDATYNAAFFHGNKWGKKNTFHPLTGDKKSIWSSYRRTNVNV